MEVAGTKTSAKQLDVLLTWRGRVGLFKRSRHSSTASVPWQLLSSPQPERTSEDDELLHCIQLLHGGTGLTVRDILTIQAGPTIELVHGSRCTSHFVYEVETNHRRLALGPGYSVYRWVKRQKVRRFDGGADWLAPILEAATSTSRGPVPGGGGTPDVEA